MDVPSGNQTGLNETASTSGTGRPPSMGILKMRAAGPSRAAMAIHLPSGDQDGAPCTSSDSASIRAPVPSAFMHHSTPRPRRRTTTQTLLLIGEIAAAPAMAPSVGLHSSLAPAADAFHRPSAPPRAAR